MLNAFCLVGVEAYKGLGVLEKEVLSNIEVAIPYIEIMSTREHWNKAYPSKPHEGLSWYQAEPTLSLGLIADCTVDPDAAIGDIGGGLLDFAVAYSN